MNTYIINSIDEFHKCYSLLKNTSLMNSVHLVGFDIEYICQANFPESFKKAYNWVKATPKNIATCTIQISTDKICLIIHLPSLGKYLPKKLINIITNTSWIKAGIGIDMDLCMLSENYNLGHCGGGLELKNLAIMSGIKTPNLEYLYNNIVGDNIKKSCSVCDWSIPLTKKQISYASMDGLMSYKLAVAMLNPSIKYMKNIFKTTNTQQNSMIYQATIKETSLFMPYYKNITQINKFTDKKSSSLLDINIIGSEAKAPTSTRSVWGSNIRKIPENINYVGRLNEYSQQNNMSLPRYECEQLAGGHMPKFKITCIFDNNSQCGIASSKKEAKRIAAENLHKMLYKH